MACKWCCILGHCCIPSAVSHDAGHLVKTCQEEVYLQPVVDPEWSLVLLQSVVACQFRIVIKPHSHTTIKCEQDLKRMWQHIDSNSYSLPLADISHSSGCLAAGVGAIRLWRHSHFLKLICRSMNLSAVHGVRRLQTLPDWCGQPAFQ